jgi:CRISPR-associated exonuclease Cas4
MSCPARSQDRPADDLPVARYHDIQVPLSALEHYEYCPRQAGLILMEDGYADDAATVRGALLHQHVDEPGADTRSDVRTLRALPVWHDGLGLTGICDVVEIYDDGRIVPVEHKSGEYIAGGPADVQLAGQAMCLEEMFRTQVTGGAIFSGTDRRRYHVAVTAGLRARAAAAVRDVRALLSQYALPAPAADRRCRRCSMNDLCLPKVLVGHGTYARAAAAVFTPAGEPEGPWDDG